MEKLLAKRTRTLYLVSDSSGNLLEHFFGAVLTQFPPHAFDIRMFSFIKSGEDFLKVLPEMEEGIIFHAVASAELKALIKEECADRRLASWDVTGPTVEFLERTAGLKVSQIPKPIHPLDEKYTDRIEALEFAMQHDDNRRIDELEKAEIILTGVSRVSKSPNALFLAYRGFRVANVSWDPRLGLPGPLAAHKKKNVAALTLRPAKLAQIRKRRFSKWHLEEFEYADLSSVILEVMESEKVYKEKGWPIIDTSDLTVEETSALILTQLGLKPKIFR